MVRKRTKRYSRSSDVDSESDLESESPVPEEPAQKKYSLRQRRRPIFTDFDYELDEDEEYIQSHQTDDEDFVVDQEETFDTITPPALQIEPTEDSEFIDNSTYIKKIEPEVGVPEECTGLIDFEDMIRADIVVNKNRIDYDNLIEKTEIKIHPTNHVKDEVEPKIKRKTPGRRGRKPKVREFIPEEVENGHSIFQNLLEPVIDENNDTNSSDDLPLAVALRRQSQNEQKEKEDLQATVVMSVEVSPEEMFSKQSPLNVENKNISSEVIENGISTVECNLEESSELKGLNNLFNPEEVQNFVETPEDTGLVSNVNGHVLSENVCTEDNDDVILIEEPANVIVLDD